MDNIKNNSGTLPQVRTGDNEDFWQRALRLSEQRLNVLASNIANSDTPNYKARDIDFQAELQKALGNVSPMAAPAGETKSRTTNYGVDAPLMYRIPAQGSVDGNTVDMDRERSAFAEQAVRHQFMLQKVADEYKEMESMLKNNPG
jgi:flagellar basal-body rod protein FlgB